MHAVDRVEAVAGAGLRGDRYFEPGAEPARQLTLIESEELERLAAEAGIELAPGESRRQLTTRGVRLNPLVGRRFRVGEVECRGIELCEPCSHLQKLTARDGPDARARAQGRPERRDHHRRRDRRRRR